MTLHKELKRLSLHDLRQLFAEVNSHYTLAQSSNKKELIKAILAGPYKQGGGGSRIEDPVNCQGSPFADKTDNVIASLFESMSNNDIERLLKTDSELAQRFYLSLSDQRSLPLTRRVLTKRFRNALRKQGINIPYTLLDAEVLNLIGDGSIRKLKQISTVPVEIGGLKFVKSLDLSNNNFANLPQEIGDMTSLRGLTLRNTPLQDLPRTLIRLKNLKRLDISNTPIAWHGKVTSPRIIEILDKLKSQGVQITY